MGAATADRWAPRWWGVFLIGLGLWIATVAVAGLTHDPILLPTIVLIGSFLIPVTAVVWYLDHDPSAVLTPRRIFAAFVVAGVIGVLAASVLEYYLLVPGNPGYFEVGLIEEFVKGVAIVFIGWRMHSYHTRDGMVLGATVGFGFAALESSGYALVSLFVLHGHTLTLSLSAIVVTELLRGLLAPFGHGLWSALLGGVIFRAARDGHLRFTWGIAITFIGISVLHAAFDLTSSVTGYIVISVIGVIPLVYLWRLPDAQVPSQAPGSPRA